jgi:hypothetical protein
MKERLTTAVRWITGITLLILSIQSVLHGFLLQRLVASFEIAAAAAFCLPRVWRIGGYGLLAVLSFAFVHHALKGAPPTGLIFAVLVVILELAHERP